jgi:hypothetical protein
MGNEEAILAKLSEIMARLDALESVRTEQVVIEGGNVTISTGEYAPICVANAEKLQVKAKRGVSLYVGGDMKGDVKTESGKVRVKWKGDLKGGSLVDSGEVTVKSK